MASDDDNVVRSPTLAKSELIDFMAEEVSQHLSYQDVEVSVNRILECMAQALETGERIEIRGFGSLTLRYRPSRVGRNPKSGARVNVPEKYLPHFKPGANLRDRVNHGSGG